MTHPEPVVHRRAHAAPKQVKFPARRHNTRSGPARILPAKLKRQSTLTQLDFVSTPHSSSREVDESVSSECEEEFSEPKPKRRRNKLDQKSRDQSTLTQNWRLRWTENADQGSSDGESAGWEEDATIMDTLQERKAQDTQGTLYGQALYVSSESQELAGDSQSVVSPAPLQHRMLVASSDAGEGSTRPSTAESRANPKTPKRVRRTEVPSSQTPLSAMLSIHRSRKNLDEEASPLKDRSCTPVPLKKALRSQTSSPSKRMLEHVDSDVLKLASLASVDPQSEPWKADIVSSPLQNQMPAPVKRQLIRTTTVPDSQDDVGSDELSPKLSRRNLKRTSTVLDSEEGSDLDDIDEHDTELPMGIDKPEQEHEEMCKTWCHARVDVPRPFKISLEDDHIGDEVSLHVEEEERGDATQDESGEAEDEEELSDDYRDTASLQQQTFDPVNAALDRDAARFGRGPTQLETQPQSYAVFERNNVEDEMQSCEDGVGNDTADAALHGDKERIEDSEPEFVAESPVDSHPVVTECVADSPHAELQCQFSPDRRDFTQLPANANNKRFADAAPVNAMYAQSTVEIPDVNDLDLPLPSSPKPPRPSQVSTVASTQRTSSRPHSAHGNVPLSPPKSAAWANMLSSSPFPLPPESWLAAQSYRDPETQSSDILDFSLPPPPPLLSSARQTPASSSR